MRRTLILCVLSCTLCVAVTRAGESSAIGRRLLQGTCGTAANPCDPQGGCRVCNPATDTCVNARPGGCRLDGFTKEGMCLAAAPGAEANTCQVWDCYGNTVFPLPTVWHGDAGPFFIHKTAVSYYCQALGFEDVVSYNALTIGELGYSITGSIATTKLFDPVTSQAIPCDPQRPMACQVVTALMCAPKNAHPGALTVGCIRDDKGNQGEENEGRGNWGHRNKGNRNKGNNNVGSRNLGNENLGGDWVGCRNMGVWRNDRDKNAPYELPGNKMHIMLGIAAKVAENDLTTIFGTCEESVLSLHAT